MVTINRAVDHLIDVLAGEDVPVVGSKATRVDQLANMIADGEIVIGGGGESYDLVIKANHTQPTSITEGELVSGSYAAACAKGLQEQPLTAMVYGVSPGSDHSVMNFLINGVWFSDYVPEGTDNTLQVAFSDAIGDGGQFTILSDDTVEFS